MRFYGMVVCGIVIGISAGAMAQVQEVKTDIQSKVYRPSQDDFKKFSSEEQRAYQAAGLTPYTGRQVPALNKVEPEAAAPTPGAAPSGDRAVRAKRPITPADLAPVPQKRSARPQLGGKGSLNLNAPVARTPADDPDIMATGDDLSPEGI